MQSFSELLRELYIGLLGYFWITSLMFIVLFIAIALLLLPIGFVSGWHSFSSWIKKTGLFLSIFFTCGIPAQILWSSLVIGRYYNPGGDIIIEWSPFLPAGDWLVDKGSGGYYLQKATSHTLFMVWLILTILVFSISALLFFLINRRFSKKVRKSRQAVY